MPSNCPQFEYWKESLECALDAAGVWGVLSDGVIAKVAESLVSSAENQSMAFGYDAIPNPVNAEIARLERLREAESREHEKTVRTCEKAIANLAHCEPRQVYIRTNDVTINRR